MYSSKLVKKSNKIHTKVLAAKSQKSSYFPDKNAGFTLIEMLAVVLIIAVLSAIAAPGWVSFTNRQQLNKVNDIVLSAIQEAQREAKKQKLGYSLSFRTDNNIPQIAVYPKGSTPIWRKLVGELEIKAGKIVLGTNLTGENTTTSNNVSYATAFDASKPQTITFDYTGALDLLVKTNSDSLTSLQNSKIGDKGLIVAVAVAKSGSPTEATEEKRCVIVKTLLGSVKIGKNAIECK